MHQLGTCWNRVVDTGRAMDTLEVHPLDIHPSIRTIPLHHCKGVSSAGLRSWLRPHECILHRRHAAPRAPAGSCVAARFQQWPG